MITGVGFLGAGTIIYTKGTIRGLTTAASLWVVACLGLAIGMGYYEISVMATIAIVVTLVILKKFQSKFIARMREINIEIQYLKDRGIFEFIESTFAENAIRIDNIKFIHGENDKHTALYSISIPKFVETKELINSLSVNDGIMSVISK